MDSLLQMAHKLTFEELDAAKKKVGYCNERGHAITGFQYPLEDPLFYVKYPVSPMLPEARTQQFVYDALEKLPPKVRQGIRVPKIYRTIPRYTNGGFIIMELVRGHTLRDLELTVWADEDDESFNAKSEHCISEVSRGIKLLLSLPVPPDEKPGPCGGGIIYHPFFLDDYFAPMVFESVDMLELYLNKLATWFPEGSTLTLERELSLVYSDLFPGNFMFTDDGSLYIIDFQHASFLPLCFQEFVFRFPMIKSMGLVREIKNDFVFPDNGNVDILLKISRLSKIPPFRLGFPESQNQERKIISCANLRKGMVRTNKLNSVNKRSEVKPRQNKQCSLSRNHITSLYTT